MARKKVTDRDIEMMEMVCDGKALKEIADTYTLHIRTVDAVFGRLRRRFGAKSMPHLVALLFRNEILKQIKNSMYQKKEYYIKVVVTSELLPQNDGNVSNNIASGIFSAFRGWKNTGVTIEDIILDNEGKIIIQQPKCS